MVLDDVEHVLSWASELADLLATCVDLVVLAASRTPLRVRAEQQVRIAPLEADAAMRLFRERAAAAGEALVARRTDRASRRGSL